MPTGDPETLYDKLAAAYIEQMQFRNVPHPRVMLIFSGIPGSGKTTLARKLAADLQAQYVYHDGIRDMMRSMDMDPLTVPMPHISKRIVEHVMANDKNRFVILDGSIDRTWNIFFDHAKQLDALPIVIRLDVPLTVIRSRIEGRMRHDDKALLDILQDYKEQFDNCCKHVTADVTIREQYNYDDVLTQLCSLIATKAK